MKVAIYTLGCKVNQYETQAMEQELLRRGHQLADFESDADAYTINTCTVTAGTTYEKYKFHDVGSIIVNGEDQADKAE